MFTVSNAFLMSSATVIVCSGGLFCLNPVAMVLFMLCSACRVVVFEAMLRGDVWDIVCDVWGVVSSPVFLLSLREVGWVCIMCLCACLCLFLELE